MLSERLALLVSLDAQGAIRGLNDIGKAADRNLSKTDQKLNRAAHGMQKMGVGMLAAGGLAAAGLFKAGQAASDLDQSIGGTEAVFKQASGYIDKYAKNAATKMGLSESAFRNATTKIGGQLQGVGFDMDDAAEKSVELTGIAADLAATFGGTTAEAVDALSAAFRGEADPAERFNLRLNQNTVNAKAVELGLAASTNQVDAHAKAQATLALIMEQSADAQGQFARESDTAAGSMAIATANLENAKAQLGEAVAPIIADVSGKVAGLSKGFVELNEKTGGLASTLATYGTIGLAAGGGILYVTGKVIEMRKSIQDLGDLGGLKGALGGIGVAAAGAATAWALWNDTMDESRDKGREQAKSIREQFAGLDPSTVSIEKLRGVIQGLDGDIADMHATQSGSSAIWDEDFRQQLGASIDEGNKFRKELKEQEAAAVALAEKMGITEDKALQLTLAGKNLGAGLNETTGEFDEQAAAAAGLNKAIDDLQNAVLAQFDSQLGYRHSLDSTEDSLLAVTEAQKKGKDGTEEYQRAVLDAEDAVLGQAAAAAKMAEDQATANGQTLDAAAKNAIMVGELVKVRDTLAPGSPLRKALDGYIWNLSHVPATVKTTASLDISQAVGAVQTLVAKFGAVEGSRRFAARIDAQYHATGGPVYASQGMFMSKGTDTIPAMLSDGEFVTKSKSVDKYGLGMMQAINNGTYQPGGGGGGGMAWPTSLTLVVDGQQFSARIVADGQATGPRRGIGVGR